MAKPDPTKVSPVRPLLRPVSGYGLRREGDEIMTDNVPPQPEPTESDKRATPPPADVLPEPPQVSASFVPPPMYVAPPAPQTGSFKRGFGLGAGLSIGLGLGMIVFTIIGGLISLMALGALAASATSSTAINRIETLWGADSAQTSETVRAIKVSGGITGESSGGGLLGSASTSGYEVADLIDSLGPEDGKGIVLLMNTPGGTINGSKAIADAVKRYQKRTNQKVIAYVRGLSASGGMMAMAGADMIISDYGSFIGSIGVVFGPRVRYKDVVATGSTLTEQGVTTTGGITQEYLTQGKGKDFGNPYRDMSEEERQVFMKGLSNEYEDFVNWVSSQRKIAPEKIRDELGAYIFDPKTAKEKGLIDEIMGPDEAFRHIASQMDIDPEKMRVVIPAAPSTWESLLGAESRIYGEIPPVEANTKVTNPICTQPQVLAFHGSLSSVCG